MAPRARDATPREATPEEGRKLVTVLFGDVAGFTSMSERLDAEEAHDIMRPCFALMREAVHQYGGTVSQFLGDGIMALFGAPLALEDHAERGILAALSIQSALQDFEKEILACALGCIAAPSSWAPSART
jgi:class 3 adenylate cyclase